MTDLANRDRSVTKNDYLETAEPGGIYYWQVMDPGSALSPTPELLRHGTRGRDAMLTATLDLEDMWAGAVSKAVTKIAVRGYEISDQNDSDRKTEYSKNLVMNFDGSSEYRSGMAKTVQDFLLCDNGWFVEVARVSDKPGSKALALYHLDSFRCWRTGNLDYPVVYQDYDGVFHKMRSDQVIFGADLPSPRSRMFNVGRCAASRAFQTIVKLSAVETYFREKITGSRALALYFITGVGRQQLQDAMETSEAEKVRKGHVVYKGAVMVPIMTDQAINVASIDLAGVPDGFDVDQERRDAYLRYANALGIPVQDIQPLSGQGLGTGTQSVILDEAQEGQGIAFFVKDFEDKVNNLVIPKTTIFLIKANDVRDRKSEAELAQQKATTIMTLMGTGQQPGVINQQMALQMAVDEGLVPPEFLPQDATPGQTLTDSGDQSKPAEPATVAPYAGQLPAPQPAAPAAAAPAPVTKSIDDEWEEAVKWAEAADERKP